MKTSNILYSIAIYTLAIISIIAIVTIDVMVFSLPLVIIMNILAYKMILKKYKKNPNERVENNTNDMTMLYLCKIGGCFWLAFCLCYLLMLLGIFKEENSLLGGIILLFIIIFVFTPSVKEGVRTIQERYVYSQTKKQRSHESGIERNRSFKI